MPVIIKVNYEITNMGSGVLPQYYTSYKNSLQLKLNLKTNK